MENKTIYTACFGDYDNFFPGADIYFNEVNNPFDGSSEHLSSRLMAKLYKVLNPLSYDIWIDASVEIIHRKRFKDLFAGDFCAFKHPFHKNIKEELELCHKIGYVNSVQKENIERLYNSAGMKLEETPVYACTILFHTEKSKRLSELWWKYISLYSYRDQLTLPYVLNQFPKLDFRPLDIDIYNNKIFHVNSHKR